ncbi:MAG: hypothetical protein BroJett005_04080 [Ignavibacteriota bacterium]|nr:MAG: hypothetical protein BroJett005_04080 [Ignavibacteriota bacterium]
MENIFEYIICRLTLKGISSISLNIIKREENIVARKKMLVKIILDKSNFNTRSNTIFNNSPIIRKTIRRIVIAKFNSV